MAMKSPRAIALENNERFYVTDKKCPKMHDAPRYTSNGTCVVCNASYPHQSVEQILQEARNELSDTQGDIWMPIPDENILVSLTISGLTEEPYTVMGEKVAKDGILSLHLHLDTPEE